MSRTINSADLSLSGTGSAIFALATACNEVHVPFFLVGALARDILLFHIRGIPRSPRLTEDVDIAVAVQDWAQFEKLTTTLVDRYGFARTRSTHRLKASGSLLVDIVPFGSIEDAAARVSWPPDFSFEISVLGYRESLGITESVQIDGATIQVISLSAFEPMKLLAWYDRRTLTPRDAEDLCFVLSNYFNAEQERMVERHFDLFDAEDGDALLIGSRAYGRDAAQFVSRNGELKRRVLKILERETKDFDESRLAVAMGRQCIRAVERRFETVCRFYVGLKEAL